MAFGFRSLSQITEADVNSLVQAGETESRTIDFKSGAVGKSDNDRKEFLYDISSFANAAGGHLVIGVEETHGRATAIPGLAGIDPDAEIARLEQMARDGIRPPVPGIESTAVPIAGGRFVIIISIPKSWNAPHQVTYQNAFRFYGRGTNGKYQIDVDELRSVFALSGNVAERFRAFRVERVSRIAADDAAVPLRPGAKAVVHIVPLSGFGTLAGPDLSPLWRDPRPLFRAYGGGGSHRFNLDGIVFSSGQLPSSGFVQVLRSGAVEIVKRYADTGHQPPQFPSSAFEGDIAKAVVGAHEIYKALRTPAPFIVMLTLIGVKGWRMAGPIRYDDEALFDRDPALVPELLLENLSGDPWHMLKPLLDLVWNAAGLPASPNYDSNGSRTAS